VDTGDQAQFRLTAQSDRYQINTAIAPGEFLSFGYAIDPGLASDASPSFTVHAGAVLPAPNWVGGILTWTPTMVDGNSSWFEQARVVLESNQAPEPTGILAILIWCAGLVAITKRIRGSRT
jgi:hypothetical protein